MLYSREPDDTTLRLDPISGIRVPSLIFVHNWQEIIDRMAGVRTETPEQFMERIRQQNLDYVREYINGLLENENASIYQNIFASMAELEMDDSSELSLHLTNTVMVS